MSDLGIFCEEKSGDPVYPCGELFTLKDMELFGDEVGSSVNKKEIYKRLKHTSNIRYCVRPPITDCMNEIFDGLLTDMPNFKDVIEHLRAQAALRNRSPEPIMGSQPILLISEPGMGKSYFAERLANELSLEFYAVDMATITASFELTGGSSQWAESKPGRIYSNLISGSTLNPLILLDEVEKAPKGQYPVHGALFRILNPMQSNRYIDESVQPLAINASRIMYVLTANSLEDVHQAIIDRCLVFNIESPTKTQAVNVAKSIWKSIRLSETWAATFDEQLSNDVLSILSKQTPRSMRKCLENAMATCAIRGGGSEILGSVLNCTQN